MTLRIECEQCGCRFAVVGAAYFCPACGQNSAQQTFFQSITKVRNAVAASPKVAGAVESRDVAAQLAQHLIESQLNTLVTALQRLAESTYPFLPDPVVKPRRNAFQRLDQGSGLWHAAGGRTFDEMIGKPTLSRLKVFFQQRHVIAHRDGLVDREYIEKSADETYTVGQRLVITESAVLEFADLVERLAAGMFRDIDGDTRQDCQQPS